MNEDLTRATLSPLRRICAILVLLRQEVETKSHPPEFLHKGKARLKLGMYLKSPRVVWVDLLLEPRVPFPLCLESHY